MDECKPLPIFRTVVAGAASGEGRLGRGRHAATRGDGRGPRGAAWRVVRLASRGKLLASTCLVRVILHAMATRTSLVDFRNASLRRPTVNGPLRFLARLAMVMASSARDASPFRTRSGFHSSTSQLNLGRFVCVAPRRVGETRPAFRAAVLF
jgi:hypothetical protein